MIRYLHIRNIAVVENLAVEFGPGLNVVTGETGSGKSILVDALGLLLGQRASADLIRTGESKALVEGVFDLPADAPPKALLEEQGIEWDPDGLVVRREIAAAGAGKVLVNGSPVNAAFLKRMGEHLVEIHGQNDTRLLLQPRYHLELLDARHGRSGLLDRVRGLSRALADLTAEREALVRDEHQRLQRLDLLDYQVREISDASPSPGEDQALQDERRVAVHAETLQKAASEGHEQLFEAENAVTAVVDRVLRRVEEAAGMDERLAPIAELLRSALYQVEDAAGQLRDYAHRVEYSEARLNEIETRLSVLDRLKRKYGPALGDVLSHLKAAREEQERLAGSDARREAIDRETVRLREAYLQAARELAKVRREAAAAVESGVQAHLADLAMARTVFRVEFTPEPDPAAAPPTGLEDAEFLVSPNPGEEPRPLRKIASGGELSRIALALKLVLHSERDAALVFDEVDAGVGGATAARLGRKLREIAALNQTFCVTHVPQIAARAGHHFQLEKAVEGGRTVVLIRPLDPGGRVEEIARMLGAETVTDPSRDAARQLLEDRG